MLRKQYRLQKNAQIKDLRMRGRSWHNRWCVLVKYANNGQESRFAFSVSRRLGKAVVRNRIKRVMRDCIRRRLDSIPAGWDVLLIARQPIQKASFEQIDGAIVDLLSRSRLQFENQCTAPGSHPATSPEQEIRPHGACA
jgi:ribonuclease P protein component